MMKIFAVFNLFLVFLLASCNEVNSLKENTAKSASITKIALFDDVEKTRSILSKNGIGELRPWRSSDEGGFVSITSYFEFGDKSKGLPNNLAYYLRGPNEDYIRSLRLVLNINNKNEKAQALSKFKQVSEATFKSLSLDFPKGLSDAIGKEKQFREENETFITILEIDKSRIDSWKLEIQSK